MDSVSAAFAMRIIADPFRTKCQRVRTGRTQHKPGPRTAANDVVTFGYSERVKKCPFWA